MNGQYQKVHSTADIDQLSTKLALARPGQESAQTPATTTGESISDTSERMISQA